MTRRDALAALIKAAETGKVGMGLNTAAVFGDNQTAMDAVDAFHGSLDAALALHNALLSGWGWAVEATSAACVWHPDTHGVSRDIELSETPARALLLADLRALAGSVK